MMYSEAESVDQSLDLSLAHVASDSQGYEQWFREYQALAQQAPHPLQPTRTRLTTGDFAYPQVESNREPQTDKTGAVIPVMHSSTPEAIIPTRSISAPYHSHVLRRSTLSKTRLTSCEVLPQVVVHDIEGMRTPAERKAQRLRRMEQLRNSPRRARPSRLLRTNRYRSRRGIQLTRSESGRFVFKAAPDGSSPSYTPTGHSPQWYPRFTGDLTPAAQKIVPPISPSVNVHISQRLRGSLFPGMSLYLITQSRHFTLWFVLIALFALGILGGIGLDTLIANYRW